MGYYTSYVLTLVGEENKVKAFEQDLLDESADPDGTPNDCVQKLIYCGYINAKLCYLTAWINTVAPRHPDVLVILHGEGEESDDLWETRWKGNESETQSAIIPPFTNPNLLSENQPINKK